MVKATPERVEAELAELRRRALSITDLGQAVSTAVGQVVPHDGYVLIWFDPISRIRSLHTGGNALRDRECLLVENETFHGDLNRFTALAASSCPVGLLGTGAPAERHSTRLHEMIRPAGFTCEARVVLHADAHMWGALVLLGAGRPYDERDAAHLATLARPLTEIVRQQPIRPTGFPQPDPRPPGVILLGPHNSVEAISTQAQAWLSELPGGTDHGGPVPMVAYAVADAARTAWTHTHGHQRASAVTRVRTLAGNWLALHGCLLDPDPHGRVALTLQAATPREMLPAFLAWSRLTRRETEVVTHLLAGTPVKQIARRLGLSILTVNDHLKAIYRKTNVHGRDELTAYLTTRMP
jgi:DNA-binding CsgD family transcriptional regulator